MYYKPDPDKAYESIEYITNNLTLGWLVRGMHKWGASVFIILLFFHMARTFLFGAYKYPRELNWIIGVLLLVSGMLEGFTGYLLPWDPDGVLGDRGRDQPQRHRAVRGPVPRAVLQGGLNIGTDTLPKFYSLHMLLIPGLIFALIGLHLYLVVRLGVSSPPWSETAAGTRARGDRRARGAHPRPRGRGRGVDDERASTRTRASSSATRRTSRAKGSRSSPTRCSTTR
jgi:ubiquinol-cytochrome c reductase cytochrome b subunit/menaquinol-cytochrome c reductase cytochrome b subunit